MIKELLKNWDLSKPIVRGFVDDEVTEDILRASEVEELEPILRKLAPEQRALFENQFESWDSDAPMMMDASGLESSSYHPKPGRSYVPDSGLKYSSRLITLVSSENSPQCPEEAFHSSYAVFRNLFPEAKEGITSAESLRSVLMSSLMGPEILSFYEKNQCLDAFHTKKLATIIINTELRNSPSKTISTHHLKELSHYIVELFPSEVLDAWYIPSQRVNEKKFITPRGRLSVLYQNTRKILIRNGIVKSKRARIAAPARSDEEDVSDELKDQLQWLTTNCQPDETVELYWTATLQQRLRALKESSSSICEYFEKYPALKTQIGIKLLLLDFDAMHVNLKHELFSNWPNIKDKLITLAIQKEKTDKNFRESIQELEINLNEIDDDISTVNAFLILGLLLNVAKGIKGSKGIWRPTKAETLDSVLCRVKTFEDIKSKLDEKQHICESFGLSLQPFPLVVMQQSPPCCESYVVVDRLLYSVESPIVAIDACFKIYQVLSTNYPFEAKITWNFIQQHIFKLRTEFEEKFSSVRKLASDLRL